MLASWHKSDDPFSAEGIKYRAERDMLRAGATLVLKDAATGEELTRITPEHASRREGSVGYN
jgi:hypothetical protein